LLNAVWPSISANVTNQAQRLALSKQLQDAIIAGEAARLARLFTDDGVLLGLTGSVSKGRAEIQKVLEDSLRHAKYLSGGFTIETLDLQNNLAIEIVGFTWDRSLDGGPPTGPQKGHALAVWQLRPDGQWLLRAWSAKYDPKS